MRRIFLHVGAGAGDEFGVCVCALSVCAVTVDATAVLTTDECRCRSGIGLLPPLSSHRMSATATLSGHEPTRNSYVYFRHGPHSSRVRTCGCYRQVSGGRKREVNAGITKDRRGASFGENVGLPQS